jgi:hypothetical protein
VSSTLLIGQRIFKFTDVLCIPAENLYPVRQLHYFAGLEGVYLAVGVPYLRPGNRFPIGKYLKQIIHVDSALTKDVFVQGLRSLLKLL